MNFPNCPFVVVPYEIDRMSTEKKFIAGKSSKNPIYFKNFSDLNSYTQKEGFFPGCDLIEETDRFIFYRIEYSGGWGLGYLFDFIYDKIKNEFLYKCGDSDDLFDFSQLENGSEMKPGIFVKDKSKCIIGSKNFWKIYQCAFLYSNSKEFSNGLRITHPFNDHDVIFINYIDEWVPEKSNSDSDVDTFADIEFFEN
jgi:hypothetical protein